MSLILNADLMTLLTDMQATMTEMQADLKTLRAELRDRPKNLPSPRVSYSTEEVGTMLGRTEYTVREWCRHGRISATKSEERRGGAALWRIAAEEVERFKNEGLLLGP